jgi:hypothetical protein
LERWIEQESYGPGTFPSKETPAEERGSVKRLVLLLWILGALGLASCNTAPASTALTCTTTAATSSTTSSSVACTDPATNITVALSPATLTTTVVTQTQFFGSVSGGTDTIITWKVNNITGGNPTIGTIDSTGLYTAPSITPSPATVTVSATSFEDTVAVATSAVTITPPPTVTVSPTTWTMPSGLASTKQFNSIVTGATTTNVNWRVGSPTTNPVPGGNATLGTIDFNGIYTAPATPPPGSTVFIQAASQDFPLSTASATVTISGYTTSSLQGAFAFSIAGQTAAGPFFRAGTFSADGAGNLFSGVEDINEASGVTSNVSFIGAYTVATDGRGTLTFNDSHTPGTYNFVLVNGTRLQIFGFDASGTASGEAELCNPATFKNSALHGIYIFDFAGVAGSSGLSQIGEFKADGAGNLTAGQMDSNSGGTPSSAAISGGTYLVNTANGRGTAQISTGGAVLNFAFYIVNASTAKFVGTDTAERVAGFASQQTPDAVFTSSSINGSYAFLLSNSAAGNTYAAAGSLSADGAGNVVTGSVVDENLSGSPNVTLQPTGSYALSGANGRGTVSLSGSRSYVFYFISSAGGFFQETDPNHGSVAGDGIFARQQSSSFSTSQISGNYAAAAIGLAGPFSESFAGEFAANSGGIGSGLLDFNTAGALTPAQTVTGFYGASAPAIRGTLTLTLPSPLNQTRNFAIYVVQVPDALPYQQIFLVGADANRVVSGSLFRQF